MSLSLIELICGPTVRWTVETVGSACSIVALWSFRVIRTSSREDRRGFFIRMAEFLLTFADPKRFAHGRGVDGAGYAKAAPVSCAAQSESVAALALAEFRMAITAWHRRRP